MNEEVLKILNQEIGLGERKTINLNIAKLYTSTKVEIPIIVERSKIPGPTVLITAGIHGDEINGVEIVRQLIQKKINRPKIGTTICIPVLNVFGFLSMDRNFPDGRDLNRVFPGTKNGSLASRFAYQFTTEILPYVDICLDFHTGGASRNNAPQIRVADAFDQNMELAKVFNAPFILFSKNLEKSYRSTCAKMGKKILLYEGGKSLANDKTIAKEGVEGTKRVLQYLGMLRDEFSLPEINFRSVIIKESNWIRAKYSGLLHLKVTCGTPVEKGALLASITDPYGKMRHVIKAPYNGYIINTNEAPIVYQGDAIFHLSKETNDESGIKVEI